MGLEKRKYRNCNCSDEEHERLSNLSPEEQEIEQCLRGCELIEGGIRG